jgi:hypothetical protein
MQAGYARRPQEAADEELHGRRIDALWDFVRNPAYLAFAEIAMASRTDPHLRELVKEQYAEYQKQADQGAAQNMPEWQNDVEQFRLISRLVLTCLEGMAIRQSFGVSDEPEDAALRDYLKKLVAGVFRETQEILRPQ